MRCILPVFLLACTSGPDVDPPPPVEAALTVVETAPPVPEGPDTDGDLLSDADEAAWGTDPDVPDTDDDGWTDGYEVWDHADPLDPDDQPYVGGWHTGGCSDDIVATGDGVGQIANDFTLLDQHGQAVRLHDFCDRQVLLISGALWCRACQIEAPDQQGWFESFGPQGFIVITLLGEDLYGRPADVGDAATWAEAFDLTHPVLVDAQWGITQRFTGSGQVLLPAMHQLAPGMEVLQVDTVLGENSIVEALP